MVRDFARVGFDVIDGSSDADLEQLPTPPPGLQPLTLIASIGDEPGLPREAWTGGDAGRDTAPPKADHVTTFAVETKIDAEIGAGLTASHTQAIDVSNPAFDLSNTIAVAGASVSPDVPDVLQFDHPADPDALDYSLPVAHQPTLSALYTEAPNGIAGASHGNFLSGFSFVAGNFPAGVSNALPGMSEAALQIGPAELGLHGLGTHSSPTPQDTSPSESAEISFINGIDEGGNIVGTSFMTWNGDNPATYNASTSGVAKWGDNQAGTPGGTIDYYFDPASHWNATEKSDFAAGLTLWSDEVNIHFVLTKNSGDAQITFERNTIDNAFTTTSFSVNPGAGTIGTSDLNTIVQGTTSIDTTDGNGWGPITGSFTAYGGYPWDTIVHEEGHELGLGHDGPYNGTVDSPTQQFSEYDSRLWSIMSYIQPDDNTAKYFSQYPVLAHWGTTYTNGSYWFNAPFTPMALDIVAAQELYGASTSGTFSGGQTFGFHCNIADAAKPFFDFTVDTQPIVTLYDTGLGNTLDLSGYSSDSTVSLFAGTFSSCASLTNNVCIAYGTNIDHAIGGSGDDTIVANNNNTNKLEGGAGNDTLVAGLGTDTLDGNSGNDTIKMDANLTAADRINGGGGSDTLTLNGDYSHGFTFAAATMVNVGTIELHNGYSYALTTNDATVAAGHTLTVDAPLLGSAYFLTFNGSAETDGRFVVTGGAGDDALIGGAGGDTLNGGDGNDLIGTGNGGNDVINGGAGDDTIVFGADLTSADKINGGGGNDTVILTGDYSTDLTFAATTMANVGKLQLGGGFSYDLTTADATVAKGQTLTIDASQLHSSDSLSFDGSAETNGFFDIKGGAGADFITMGAALRADDIIDGGGGSDQVILSGDYATKPLVFNSTTMVNVETLFVDGGFSYNLTTNDATVASGKTLTVMGTTLGAGDTLTFNGTAETDGKFAITGGAGNDNLSGGAGNDTLTGGAGADVFAPGSGNDTVNGGDGNDTINMASFLNASDKINGGAGTDTLTLNGDYSAGLTFSATTMVNVDKIVLAAGFSYKLTMNDSNVPSGGQLNVDASALAAGQTLKFDGSAETDGRYVVTGGGGNDIIVGSAGNDILTGGGGNNWFTGGAGADQITASSGEHDRFIYIQVSDSTSTIHDIITGFDGTNDRFDLDVTVTGIGAEVTSGHLSKSSFDADLASALGAGQLAAGHAVLFTPTTGNLSGHTFLVVDANGTAGYQAGQDYVFDLVSPTNLNHLTTSDFI